jgi:SPASM domain peptide maturase of grasp-with-spasm system
MSISCLFANCVPIKGHLRSIIYDLQRNNYSFIPNDLFTILVHYNGKTLDKIKLAYNNKYNNVIDDYFQFLKQKEYIFTTNNPENHPAISWEYRIPTYISNSVICKQKSQSNYNSIFKEIEKLGTKAIQLRLLKYTSVSDLNLILKNTVYSRISYIEIILRYSNEYTTDNLHKLFYLHQRLFRVLIFNAPFNKTDFVDKQKSHAISYTKDYIFNNSFCGVIHPSNFVQNIPFFTESQHYNTCLNRKLCIDENGYIKNCPSMVKHYGHIDNTKLEDVVKSEEFQKLWYIKKDDINVCKDCEFRYMCMDCRAYIKNPNDIYSQPAKCHYNPYIAKWKGQEGYIPVEEYMAKEKTTL